jgi:LPS export ABC transporter protein LptC
MRGWIALLASVMTMIACRDVQQPPVATGTVADSADQVMFNVRTLLQNRGVQRAELFADTAFVFDESSRFEFRRVRTNFNTQTGAPNGTLTSDRGRYDIRLGVLEAFGNVLVVTTDGRRLTSPHLRYDQNADLVSSDSQFVMRDAQGREQHGVGFRSDPNMNRVQVLRGSGGRATVILPGEQ